MKRTRRGALALIAGSSTLLTIETLGLSSGRVDRDVAVDVVDDEDAYLGLHEETDDSGLLFDGTRTPPAPFTVQNQFPESVSVGFELDGHDVRVGRLEGDDDLLEPGVEAELDPGGELEALAVDLNPHAELDVDEDWTGQLTIAADGEGSSVTATRTFALESDILASIRVPWLETVVAVREQPVETDDGTDEEVIVIEVINWETGETTYRQETEFSFPVVLRLLLRRGIGSNDNGSDQQGRSRTDIDVDSIDTVHAAVKSPQSHDDNPGEGSPHQEQQAAGRDVVVEIAPETDTGDDDPVAKIEVPLDG